MKGMATIQVQDIWGNWRNVTTGIKQDQVIKTNIDSVARQFKGKQVRAVDENGNLLQLSR